MATIARPHPRQHRAARPTADSHDFPTRHYDLVKEFVIALGVMALLTTLLAAVFSSPDENAITMRSWAAADPNDVVATATGELAGTTTSATYGAPYNHASEGQTLLGVPLQKWGGVRHPVSSADLVLGPLAGVSGNGDLRAALARWRSASEAQRNAWATAYADALAQAPGGTRRRCRPVTTGRCPPWRRASSRWPAPVGSRER